MLGFISEELVQAICREREDEARRVRPHTERRPDPERDDPRVRSAACHTAVERSRAARRRVAVALLELRWDGLQRID